MTELDLDKKQWCVYIHTSPNEKSYVGITKMKCSQRWGKNGYNYSRSNEYFWNAIQKYGWDNFKHEIIASKLSKAEAIALEISTISSMNLTDRNYGYNFSCGGEGGNNKKIIPIEQYTTDYKYIRTFDSAADAARQFDCDRTQITRACRKNGAIAKGYLWQYEEDSNRVYRRNKICYIYQYALDGKLINLYNSLKDASRTTGIRKDSIGHCYKGKNKTAGGYLWEKEVFVVR